VTIDTTTDTTDIDIPETVSLNVIGAVIPATPSKPDLGKIKRQQRRARMEAGFDLWKATGHIDPLLKVVIEYTQQKLKLLEFDDGFKGIGTPETVDDWSQDVSIKIWKLLSEGRFKGTTFASFLKYLNVACKNRNADAFEYLNELRTTTVRLTRNVKDSFGHPTEHDEENPALYNNKEGSHSTSFHIPRSVQGTDRTICLLILAGMNHAQVAKELQMTESAVDQRVSRLRKQVAKHTVEKREAARVKRQADEHEQKTGFATRFAARRKLNAERLAASDNVSGEPR
jgi:DNA-directed RNA polymerase specialized sigma24 family protein